MKLKEAIKVLQDFVAVAGEDAEIEVRSFQLHGYIDVEYYSNQYGGWEPRQEKARHLRYRVGIEHENPCSNSAAGVGGGER